MPRTVAVLGGGHGALTLAADLALHGHAVRLFELEAFRAGIDHVFRTGHIKAVGHVLQGTGALDLVTTDINAAVSDAEIILVAVPAFGHRTYADLLAPTVKAGQLVVLVPGTLGTLEFAQTWRGLGADPSVVLAETDTFPYATRTDGAATVRAYGRTAVQVGVFPAARTAWVAGLLGGLLDVSPGSNVLEVGFSNLNPVLHPPGTIFNIGRIERSRGEFHIYEEGMTPSVTRIIDALDVERLAVAGALGLQLPPVAEALHRSGYGPRGTTWETLNGSASLTPIKGPTDVGTRYLSEDIPFGLSAWASIGSQIGVPTPLMDALVVLGSALSEQAAAASPRTVRSLGLAGLDAAEIVDYVSDGGGPRHSPR